MTQLFTIVSTGQPMQDLSEEMADRIKDVIYDYAGRVPLTLAMGVMEVVKFEIMRDAEG